MTVNPRYGMTLYLLLLLLSACGGQIELDYLPENSTILAFGDSLTAGNGAGRNESYPEVLARLSGRTVINAGVSGEVSAQGRERLPHLLDEYRPALLILCHGGNDLLRSLPLGQAETNIREMITMARTRGIAVLLLGVPRPGIFLSPDDLYERVAEDTGVIFISDLIADVLSQTSMKSDTIHPNAAGYARIADEIFRMLQSAGAL